MPVFRQGPRTPQKFFLPLAPFSGSVYCEPLPCNLRLNVGAVAQGYGGATYGGQTYAGNLGSFYAPLISTPRLVIPTTAVLTLTRFAPTVSTPRLVTPGVKALTLTTFAPTIRLAKIATPITRALLLATFAPVVSTPRLVTPGVRALSLTTFAPTVTVSSGGAVLVTPSSLALFLTTYAPNQAPDQGGSQGGSVPRGLIRIPRRAAGRPVRSAKPIPKKRTPVAQAVLLDDEDAVLALYGAGAINDEEFAALIS